MYHGIFSQKFVQERTGPERSLHSPFYHGEVSGDDQCQTIGVFPMVFFAKALHKTSGIDVPRAGCGAQTDHSTAIQAIVLILFQQSLLSFMFAGSFTLRQFEMGRESCWARVCQYVLISVVAVSLTKKTTNIRS